MIKFIEVKNETDFNSRLERTAQLHFTLGEVWINENYVVSVRPAKGYQKLLQEGRLPADLDTTHEFTAILTNNGNLTETYVVVGATAAVAERLGSDHRTLLKG
jgi:hypothetical protein